MSREALDVGAIRARLDNSILGSEILVRESVASTNDSVRERARSGAEHGLVIYAEKQQAGRGRRQAQWHAPARSSLLHSILLEPCWPVQQLGRIPLVAGLAVARAVEEVTQDLRPLIKWPNDLWLGSRKFCGILAESETVKGRTFVILGIGVNVLTTADEFHPEIQSTATSLAVESEGERYLSTREELAAAILLQLEALLNQAAGDFDELSREIRDRLLWHGKPIRCLEGTEATEGLIEGIGTNGELLLDTSTGPRRLVQAAELRPLT